jgi:hypothetical protein
MATGLADELEHVAALAATLGVTLTLRAPARLQAWIAVGILILVGIGLVLFRHFLIKTFAHTTRAKLLELEFFGHMLEDVLTALQGVVFVIRAVVDGIKALLHPKDAGTAFQTLTWPSTVTFSLVDFTHDVEQCASYTVQDAVNHAIKGTLSAHVCPVLRAAAPLRVINQTLPALAFMSYGYDPIPGDNCMPPPTIHNDALCTLLQSGGIILEILAPLLVVAIILTVCAADLFHLLWALLNLPVAALKTIPFRG